MKRFSFLLGFTLAFLATGTALAQGEREITPESEAALDRGLEWLAQNMGPEGSWQSKHLGLVSMGALAFMSAGHSPGRGKYGKVLERSLNFVVDQQKPSGLLNISDQQNRDMYNHGLSTFVLGQAHGMQTAPDRKLGKGLERAIKLIVSMQRVPGNDPNYVAGGWGYDATFQPNGYADLSLAVMQTKALRSAMDSGFDVPQETVDSAIMYIRACHRPLDGNRNVPEEELAKKPGRFHYQAGGGNASLAMASAGVVCLQELAQYDDWRIPKNMEYVTQAARDIPECKKPDGRMPFDAYTLYYASQSLYQYGGDSWDKSYPKLRDYLVRSQLQDSKNPERNGSWMDDCPDEMKKYDCHGRTGGKEGALYATSVACFVLAIPNRYLPILQQSEAVKQKFGNK